MYENIEVLLGWTETKDGSVPMRLSPEQTRPISGTLFPPRAGWSSFKREELREYYIGQALEELVRQNGGNGNRDMGFKLVFNPSGAFFSSPAPYIRQYLFDHRKNGKLIRNQRGWVLTEDTFEICLVPPPMGPRRPGEGTIILLPWLREAYVDQILYTTAPPGYYDSLESVQGPSVSVQMVGRFGDSGYKLSTCGDFTERTGNTSSQIPGIGDLVERAGNVNPSLPATIKRRRDEKAEADSGLEKKREEKRYKGGSRHDTRTSGRETSKLRWKA